MGIFHTILHPTDFDACSLEAFRVSRALAHQLGTKVVAFHVVSPPAVVMDDGRVIMDPKVPTIGTHGRTGLSRLIWGNRAEEVIRTATCAVLVVKEPAAS